MADDPLAVIRTAKYRKLLILAALLGVPIAGAAYGFLYLVDLLQRKLYTDLPSALGFHSEPLWWPLPLLALAGLIVGATIRYLPGNGGHSPADGLHVGGTTSPIDLPGIALAALATLALGAVLGPEAPLIAIGGGLAVYAVRLSRRSVEPTTAVVVGAAGSFAAISTLFGSPLPAAFLLMEAAGLGGPMMIVVLLPGLLAAGIGTLIFVGLDSWTGAGTFSLAIPNLPSVGQPTVGEFAWAIGIGLVAAFAAAGVRWLALRMRAVVEQRILLLTPVAGIAVAGLAIAYAQGSGKSSSEVLFSGQSALPSLVTTGASYSVGALMLLVACKGLAYAASMSSFRGGPVFPALFLGAAGGIALSHLPGLEMIAGVAVGIGALSAAMLKLPLTSVLLPSLLLANDGLLVMPLVIVAVVVSYLVTIRLTPSPVAAPAPAGPVTIPAEEPVSA